MKELSKSGNIIKKILIIALVLLVAVFILIKAENFIKEKTDETINLVIIIRLRQLILKHLI